MPNMRASSIQAPADIQKVISDINWSELKMPFIKTVSTTGKYYRVTFFDDFKGKPDHSAESNYCYDTLKPQCSIWGGGQTFPCDQSNLSSDDQSPTPPLVSNFKSALYSLDEGANYEDKTPAEIKQLYSSTIADRWKNVNKCNWTSYLQVNWMATDYGSPAKYSAKMDASQVTVDPRGKGYLILSARKGSVRGDCVFGGTLGPTISNYMGRACLIKNVQEALTGPIGIYWIDPNPSWPGIFYHKINGGCPYGGSGSVNCQVYSFAPGEVSPLITYGLTAVNGQATAYYFNMQKQACGFNTEYPNGGVVFNKLLCPMFDGGIFSQNSFDSTNHQNGFSQKNGIFEVKLTIPEGKGSFPAAWLMPEKGGWPYSGGEIDIMESRDAASEVYQTYHQGKCINASTKQEIVYDPNHEGQWIDNGNCQNIPGAVSINYSKGSTSVQNQGDEFHTRDHLYSVEWSDDKIQWYPNNTPNNSIGPGTPATSFDINNPIAGLTSASDIPPSLRNYDTNNMPHDPFYWILNHSTYVNNADLANWTQQDHYIDYVKVYARCFTENDFCPKGGEFVEGTGCVLRVPGRTAVIYASSCVEKFPERTCPAGGEVAGPNCQVYGFEKPAVVPGVKYWVDPNPNYPGVYYAKVNGACPFGGSAGVNCQFESLAPKLTQAQSKTVFPGVAYWVDTNPKWPGIYYHLIDGKCPLGGSGSVNCQLQAFASDYLKQGISYWVDTDPRWPGVFYHKVNGGCPYGGSGSVNCQLMSLSEPSFFLNPTVNYWLDPDVRWPGIYYHKVNGGSNNGCPYGGSGSVNCQLKSYPAPTKPYVMPGVSYWVDANPDYPGIYYHKINGGCPYGGSVGVNCQLYAFPSGVVEPGVKYWIDNNPSYPGVYYAPDFR